MTEPRDPLEEQLAGMGRQPTPAPDAAFVDRLESELRVQHAQGATRRRVSPMLRRILVGVAAAALAVLGIVGLTSRPTQSPDVSVTVFDQPDDPAAIDDAGPADPTGTPTAPPTVTPPPTATPESAAAVVPSPTPAVTATPLPDPVASPTPCVASPSSAS